MRARGKFRGSLRGGKSCGQEQSVNGGDESHMEACVSRNGTKRHHSYYGLLRFKRMREGEKIRTKNARAKLLSLSCVGSDLVTKERV